MIKRGLLLTGLLVALLVTMKEWAIVPDTPVPLSNVVYSIIDNYSITPAIAVEETTGINQKYEALAEFIIFPSPVFGVSYNVEKKFRPVLYGEVVKTVDYVPPQGKRKHRYI